MPKRKPELKKFLILDKKEGETPLEALGRLRARNKEYEKVKMTYAGRLDPMAEGLLLVLLGEEVRNKQKYLGFDKEYEFEVLFGFATDTHDILGKIVNSNITANIAKKDIEKNLKYFRGKFRQEYPLYSSKTVAGKQLWMYGRSGMEVALPDREVTVKKLKLLKIKRIKGAMLLPDISKRIDKVEGNFRQKEILSMWRTKLAGHALQNFFVGSFVVRSSSGAYVRGLAEALGKRLGVPALAYRIKRTKIGKFAKITVL